MVTRIYGVPSFNYATKSETEESKHCFEFLRRRGNEHLPRNIPGTKRSHNENTNKCVPHDVVSLARQFTRI